MGRLLTTFQKQTIKQNIAMKKVFVHLHCTMPDDDKDGPAFLFREAVRKQSEVDYAYFQKQMKTEESDYALEGNPMIGDIAGPGLPWTWYNQVRQDIFWASHLTGRTPGKETLTADKEYAMRRGW